MVPEGLTNALVGFQRFMNDIFADMIDVSIVIYLDDILIYSKDFSEATLGPRLGIPYPTPSEPALCSG